MSTASSKASYPECNLVLPSSISSYLLPRLPTPNLPNIFPSLTCFREFPTQDVTDPGSLPSGIHFILDPLKYFIFYTNCATDLLHPSPAHYRTFISDLRVSPIFSIISSCDSNMQAPIFFVFQQFLKDHRHITATYITRLCDG